MPANIFPEGSGAALFCGAALILAGFALAWKGRKKTSTILTGLCLADVGYLLCGLGLPGRAGLTGALLLALFNGPARLLAWLSLLRLSGGGSLRGVGKAKPLSGALFSLAMFAAMGVSPFLTPDAKPLVLYSGVATGGWAIPPLLTAANCATVVFTLLAVHKIWLRGAYVYEPGGWKAELGAPSLLPLVLAALLALMGLFGHEFVALAASFTGGAAATLPDFSPRWHPAVLLMYGGAFAVFLLRPFPTAAGNLLAALLPFAAFWLLFFDTSAAPLGRFFGLIVCGIGCLVAVYSWRYIRRAPAAYYFLLLLMFGSLAGVALADGLGSFFVFWELMTLASYALVAWEDTDQAHAAAKKYFLMCGVAAALMLPGLLLFHYWYGSMDIAALAGAVSGHAAVPLLFALLPVLVGCGVKAGLFPGHGWLPDAHPAAPSSISAPLSGVLTKAGIFGIFQIFLVICGVGLLNAPAAGWLLCALGGATMLYGEIMALRQDDLKRLLAYSTLGQIGEICLTLGLFTWLAATGALMHVLNHAIMKDLLFLCSGALILRSGARNLSGLRGLGKAMPFTAACMAIGLLAILGLPPFAGFMSKFMMLYALADANPWLAALLLLASLAGCVYYTRIIKTLIFEPYTGPPVAEAPWSMRLPMTVLAALCLILGLFPQLGLALILPVLDGLGAAGKIGAQALPSLVIHWPWPSLLLLCGAPLPLLLRRNPRLAGWSAAALLALAAGLVVLERPNLDALSFILALAVTAIGCLNMVYAVGYMAHSHSQWRFYSFFLCMCAGLSGVAVSSDIFSFFLFWEIMSSWSLYFVIVHEESPLALREGFKYFFFNVFGAAFLFIGVVLIIQWSGGGEFGRIRAALPALSAGQLWAFFGLMAAGFLLKAAQLPFRIDVQMHPAAAPTPVSGYISSVLLKSAVLGLVKLFLLLGGGLALARIGSDAAAAVSLSAIMNATVWIGGVTIIMAATFAVFQTDIKLVLIYSTVSQLGYMVVGVGLGTSLGVAGGLLHLVNHVFFKDLLFLTAGAVILQTHRQSMNGLGGLGARMPVTLAFFCIGAVCVIGLPPSSGFTSKWIIYHALMERGFVLVAILSLVGSVLTLAYMTKLLHGVFLGRPAPDLELVGEAPRVMLWPMGCLAAGCALTSLFPGLVLVPLNGVLAEFSLPRLDVAPWGLNSGAGAWNATLTALLFGAVWLVSSLALGRASRRGRVTGIHVCGIPPDELNPRAAPGDIYSTPAGLFRSRKRKQTANGGAGR